MPMIDRNAAETIYDDIEKLLIDDRIQMMRRLAANDLYYLMTRVCRRDDARQDWVYDRCREVQADPNDRLDLWFRGGYKSSIITQTLTLQDVIKNPEVTIGIFSHTRPNAVTFLMQIKREIEENPLFHKLWPEIFWMVPRREAPTWSAHGGLIVKRLGNPKEATVEAWGVVEGQPTGRHFDILVFDDMVSREQVGSEMMIKKTTAAWELALNLGSKHSIRRYIGTRYHFADTYHEMMRRQSVKPRIYAVRDQQGRPRYYSEEQIAQKRRDMGIETFAAQMMQNPTVDSVSGFQEAWLKFYDEHEVRPHGMNLYIIADLAHSLKKESDYTAIWVVGLASDRNYYCLDFVRDRMRPSEIIGKIMALHRCYSPHVRRVGIEQYGAMAHGDMLRERQIKENYRFPLIELGGKLKKVDRINRLHEPLKDGRFYLPRSLIRRNYEGKMIDIIREFIDYEYLAWPAPTHDDGLDALSRILDDDLGAIWPRAIERSTPIEAQRRGSQWAV